VPGSGRTQLLLPLAFCRECGQEYYTVWLHQNPSTKEAEQVSARKFSNAKNEGKPVVAGYLYASADRPWPDTNSAEAAARLPEDWVEVKDGEPVLKQHDRPEPPQPSRIRPDGPP